MAIEIKMTPAEADATYNVLKAAERKAEANWQSNPSITNRLKFETLEAARSRVAQSIPA
jgi:hypothetical protein